MGLCYGSLWLTPAGPGPCSWHPNYLRTLWIDLRLAGSAHIGSWLCVRQPTGDVPLANTRSIYGRPGCHGNCVPMQRVMERTSYTQQLIALYMKEERWPLKKRQLSNTWRGASEVTINHKSATESQQILLLEHPDPLLRDVVKFLLLQTQAALLLPREWQPQPAWKRVYVSFWKILSLVHLPWFKKNC